MSSSEAAKIYAFDASLSDVDEPVDTVGWREIANNALHYADQSAQHLVSWSAVRLTVGGGAGEETEITHSQDATANWKVCAVAGPLKLRLRDDGSTYRIVGRLGGYSTTGDAVDALVGFAREPIRYQPVGDLGAFFPTVFEYSALTNSSAAYLTPDSALHYVDLAATAVGVERGTETLTDISGDSVSVAYAYTYAHIYARCSSNATHRFFASAWRVAEFYAP